MGRWKCARCGVLCLTIPRYDDRICTWCAKEVAKFGGQYCGRCNKYHPGDDCEWERRRLARLAAIEILCRERVDDLGVAPADVRALLHKARRKRAREVLDALSG